MRIVVIGGGIAGVSAAAVLSGFGDVVLLEAETALGTHSSGRSSAMFVQDYGNAAVCALNRASRAYHEDQGVLSPRGVLMASLPADLQAFEEEFADLGFEEISVQDARRRVPILSPDIVRAGFYEDALEIDTDRLLQGFLRTARDNGAEVVTGARVTDICRDGSWRTCYIAHRPHPHYKWDWMVVLG